MSAKYYLEPGTREILTMAIWKRKALAVFPELTDELRQGDFTVYQLFFELVPLVKAAHRQGNIDTLRRSYGFAEWCLSQDSKDLWNSAGVAFYEHLFDEEALWLEVIPWLSPNVIAQVGGLWELMLKPDKYRKLLEVLDSNKAKKPELNIFSMGAIERL
jgi:hypothetical protein